MCATETIAAGNVLPDLIISLHVDVKNFVVSIDTKNNTIYILLIIHSVHSAWKNCEIMPYILGRRYMFLIPKHDADIGALTVANIDSFPHTFLRDKTALAALQETTLSES